MNELDLALEEYKLSVDTANRYFTHMYTGINITIVFWASIFVFIFNDKIQLLHLEIIFWYIVPIITYIFGLIYCYNSCSLAKLGYFQVKLELNIKKLNRKWNNSEFFEGAVIFAKKYDGKYILAYGTILMLYFLFPFLCFIIGYCINNFSIYYDYTTVKELNTVASFLPLFFYIIYLVFMIIIVSQIRQLVKMMNLLMEPERLL